ncbi:MAG: patatin-like phospholipase family protein [Acidimicrobiales bacterium]
MTETVDLVLEGGGVRGIALVGAISVLEEHGFAIARVAGTSAGAIVGSLVAAGMSAARLHEIMSSLDYGRFLDETELDHIPVLGRGLSLWHDRGVYAGDYFRGLIAEHLADLGVTTFADLRQRDPGSDLPPERRYKLLVMASDVSRGRLLRLPWDYAACGLQADEASVADAVRASMSIPFFFRPCIIPVRGAEPSLVVDGGLLSNFPVDAFDRTDGQPARWPTIGIKLIAPHAHNEVRHVVKGNLSLAMAIFSTMQTWHDELRLNDPDVERRTIFVDTFGVKATDFAIDAATQQRLFESGRSAAEAFLALRSP